MDPKIQVTISAALAALLGIGGTILLGQKDFAEMAAEVDRVRAAQAKVAAEAGQYRETVPTELAKAIEAASPDKRLLSGEACKVVEGRVFCQLEGGVELQLPPSLTSKLAPEVTAIKAEYEAAVQAKAEAIAVEAAAKAAADALAAEEAAKATPAVGAEAIIK